MLTVDEYRHITNSRNSLQLSIDQCDKDIIYASDLLNTAQDRKFYLEKEMMVYNDLLKQSIVEFETAKNAEAKNIGEN